MTIVQCGCSFCIVECPPVMMNTKKKFDRLADNGICVRKYFYPLINTFACFVVI